jgi:hypothetical protein
MQTKTIGDFDFFRKVMPNYFVVNKVSFIGKPETFRCRSNVGIDDNDEQWEFLMKAFRQRWGERFIEVNHTVCNNHTDFTIYLKDEN